MQGLNLIAYILYLYSDMILGAHKADAKDAAPERRSAEEPVRRTQVLGAAEPAPAAQNAVSPRGRALWVCLCTA